MCRCRCMRVFRRRGGLRLRLRMWRAAECAIGLIGRQAALDVVLVLLTHLVQRGADLSGGDRGAVARLSVVVAAAGMRIGCCGPFTAVAKAGFAMSEFVSIPSESSGATNRSAATSFSSRVSSISFCRKTS